MFDTFPVVHTADQLAELPDLALIVSEVGEGPEVLCKEGGQWYSFERDGRCRPTFPALVLLPRFEVPPPTRTERHAARATDPASSHRAVRARSPKWDSMNMRALRVFYSRRSAEEVLSYYDVEQRADHQWGAGALGKSPWKRCSELHTDFDPPLIERATDAEGNPLSVPGEFGDPVEAYRITPAGQAMVVAIRPQEER